MFIIFLHYTTFGHWQDYKKDAVFISLVLDYKNVEQQQLMSNKLFLMMIIIIHIIIVLTSWQK